MVALVRHEEAATDPSRQKRVLSKQAGSRNVWVLGASAEIGLDVG